MPWGATRIPALRVDRISGYSNSENISFSFLQLKKHCANNLAQPRGKKNKNAGKNNLWETSNFSISLTGLIPYSYPGGRVRGEKSGNKVGNFAWRIERGISLRASHK